MFGIRRREFISLLGGAAAAWPLAARAQQAVVQLRRIGALMGTAANDPGVKGRIASIEKPLQELGWVFGRDIEIHYRWGGGDTDLTRAYAKELIAMQPDVIIAHTNTAMAASLGRRRYRSHAGLCERIDSDAAGRHHCAHQYGNGCAAPRNHRNSYCLCHG